MKFRIMKNNPDIQYIRLEISSKGKDFEQSIAAFQEWREL